MTARFLFLVLFLSLTSAVAQDSFPTLLADNPDAEHRDKLMLFGQFVGSWSYVATVDHDDGTRVTSTGEIDFHWILQGRAVQDVWSDTDGTGGEAKPYGTTVRFYDPKSDTWRSTWISPVAGVVFPMTGRKVGSEIVIEGTSGGGKLVHWIFSDIKPNSFRWHAEKLVGKEWRTYEDLAVTRMK
jgi:hypothetical protein